MDDHPPDDARNAHIGLEFTVAIRFTRRRAVYTDAWEARFSTLAVAIITTIVLGYVIVQVFQILQRIFFHG